MAGSPVMRAQFSDILEKKGYWKAFVTEEMRSPQPEIFSQFYQKIQTEAERERFTEMVGLGTMVKSNEYGDLNYDAPIQGYDKSIVPDVYNLAVIISREAMDDDQLGVLKRHAGWFSRSSLETKEILGADPFNNGFATTKSADASYLFATDHPYEGGGTYRNKLSSDADLTISSLQQAILDMKQTTDGRGKHLRLRPKYLMVADAGEFNAREILQSEPKPFTSDNTANVTPKAYPLELIVNPYLTDADAWFLIHGDINSDIHPLKYVLRKDVETNVDRIVDKSGQPFLLTAYLRCKFDAIGWRGLFGSPGV